ncbi:immunoglobulin domain-containing protein [Parashewanella tropica]|uniref:immunoglobulin domain-containing protein n=1 Tax=Parashewanella tropica TaxID=2547970 RepID=UPI00105A7992|nr:immunoglobulin domain-containing protein [Parashewanella tropica]
MKALFLLTLLVSASVFAAAPKITLEPRQVHIKKDQTANLTCEVPNSDLLPQYFIDFKFTNELPKGFTQTPKGIEYTADVDKGWKIVQCYIVYWDKQAQRYGNAISNGAEIFISPN